MVEKKRLRDKLVKILQNHSHLRHWVILLSTVVLLALLVLGIYSVWLKKEKATIRIESPIIFAEAAMREQTDIVFIRIVMLNGIYDPGNMSDPEDDQWIGEFEIIRYNGDPENVEPIARQPLVIAGKKILTFKRGFEIIGADTNNDDHDEFAIGQSVDGTYSVYEIVYVKYTTQIGQFVPPSGLLYAAGTAPTISLAGPENQKSEFLWEAYNPETRQSKTVKYRWIYGEPIIVNYEN